jgi:hypothetical protein
VGDSADHGDFADDVGHDGLLNVLNRRIGPADAAFNAHFGVNRAK